MKEEETERVRHQGSQQYVWGYGGTMVRGWDLAEGLLGDCQVGG